jgi:hypothetical protein
VSLEPAAALGLNLFKLVKRREGSIGERLVGERPEAFCGLQLWRMRGQEEQMQPLRDHQASAFVPTGLIEHQSNVFLWPCSSLFGKGRQSK